MDVIRPRGIFHRLLVSEIITSLKEGETIFFFISINLRLDITEDRAVEVTCSAMNWKIPENWRQIRKKEAETHGMPLLDLADWDRRKIKNDDETSHNNNAKSSTSCKGEKEDGDGREEKKDSTLDEYQC
mmetsp:Transcript_19056/g.34374  ORF Transcript_19056/g.34374 Transcript_19056/m.34374 type:complete len:129 (+) Transcript_19056:616-1002(+)